MSRLSYHPLRAFVGWTLVFTGIWYISAPAVAAWTMAKLDTSTAVGGIADRFFQSSYQEANFVLLGGSIIFLMWQLAAVAVDHRVMVEGKPAGTLGRLVGLMSGRGWRFWDVGAERLSQAGHALYGPQYGQSILRLMMWVFPMFGFLGTVYGLSGAVGQLSLLTGAEGQLGTDQLQPVFAELHIAFDTTIQGILSAVLLAVLSVPLDVAWYRLRQADPGGG